MCVSGKDSQINPMDAKEDTRSVIKGNRIQETDVLLQTDPERLRGGGRKKQHGDRDAAQGDAGCPAGWRGLPPV